MLGKEINLGSDDDGIMILDDKFKIGKRLIDFYKSEFDYIFEIGLTQIDVMQCLILE